MNPTNRPAESTSVVAGAVVALIVWITGIHDPNVLAPLAIVIGAVPGVVTWLVVTIRGSRKSG